MKLYFIFDGILNNLLEEDEGWEVVNVEKVG